MKNIISLIFAFLLFTSINAQQGDTVLNFQQAKTRLIKKNLSLLASYYEIDMAQAQVIQAKVWNNPYLIWNQELYNVEKNTFFNYQNQYLVQIEQIFSIAGKHTNTVKLSKINLQISKAQFQDVIRSLLYDLGATYNTVAALQQKEILFKTVLENYERLNAATREQLRVGALSQAEALRVESEYIAVKAQAVQNYNQKEKALSAFRTLLQLPTDSTVIVDFLTPFFSPRMQVDTLVTLALDTRPDLKVAQLTREYQERNIRLQKSLSVPDIKFGFQPIDKGSNYVSQYTGFNVEMPLPVFDRNQGRIKAAQFRYQQSNYELQLQKTTVSNHVVAAFHQYTRSKEGLAYYSGDFLIQLENLNKNTSQNFQKRIISLLEFIDQQRIFILTNTQLIEMRQQYLDSINELNFSIGTQLIDY